MQRALLLDAVVRERAAVLDLLAGEDEALLVRRYALLVLDLALDALDAVRGLDVQRDGLAGQRLDEDLGGGAGAAGPGEDARLVGGARRPGGPARRQGPRDDAMGRAGLTCCEWLILGPRVD